MKCTILNFNKFQNQINFRQITNDYMCLKLILAIFNQGIKSSFLLNHMWIVNCGLVSKLDFYVKLH